MALETVADNAASSMMSGAGSMIDSLLGRDKKTSLDDVLKPIMEIAVSTDITAKNSTDIKNSIVAIEGLGTNMTALNSNIEAMTANLAQGINMDIKVSGLEGLGDMNGISAMTAPTDIAENIQTTTPTVLSALRSLFTGMGEIYNDLGKEATDGIVSIMTSVGMMTQKLNIHAKSIDSGSITSMFNLIGVMLQSLVKAGVEKSAESVSKGLIVLAKGITMFMQTVGGASALAKKAESTMNSMVSVFEAMGSINPMKIIGGFALGVALLGLAIYGFTEVINLPTMVMFGASMAIIAASVYLFSKVDTKPMLKVATSVAILGLTIYAFQELIQPKEILAVAGTIAVLAGTFWMLGKMSGQINQGAKEVLLLSASVLVLAGATMMFEQVSWGALAKTGVALLGVGVAFAVLGKLGGQITTGAIGLVVGAAAMGVFALSAMLFEDITWDTLAKMGASVVGLGIAMAGIGLASPLILLGGAALAVSAVGILALAAGLLIFQTSGISEDTVEGVGNAITSLSNVYSNLAGSVISVTAGSIAAVAMGAATLVVGSALMLVSALDIDEEKIISYGNSVTSLADVYGSIGAGTMIKMALALPSMLSMALSTLAVGGAIKLITALNLDENKVREGVTKPLNAFISAISSVLSENAGTFDEVEDGIEAFQGIGNLVGGIADGVGKMARLEFLEQEIVNGKLVTKSVRKLNEGDFAQIGLNITKIIDAVKAPLAEIGASAGLFTDSDVKNGIEELEGIGDVFTPIVSLAGMFSGETALNTTSIDSMNAGLKSMIGGVVAAFTQDGLSDLADADTGTLEDAVDIIVTLAESFAETGLDKAATSMNKIQMSMREIKNDINAMDIEKLTKMNEFFMTLQIMGENENMNEMLEKLTAMVNSINGVSEENNNTANSTTTIINKGSNAQQAQDDREEITRILTDSNSSMVDVLEEMLDVLRGTLKMKVAEAF